MSSCSWPGWVMIALLGGCSGADQDSKSKSDVTGSAGAMGTSGQPPAAPKVCVPGTTNACLGPGQCSGAQVCLESEAGWGPCDCGSTPPETGVGGLGGAPGQSQTADSGGSHEPAQGTAGASGSSPVAPASTGGLGAGGTLSMAGRGQVGGSPTAIHSSGGNVPSTGGTPPMTKPPLLLRCESGLTACPDACVDLTLDPTNCGGCGKRCADRSICVDGACAKS